MIFNAFSACYREEIEGYSEHPIPELGFPNALKYYTSNEANAVMWLRYLFAFWNYDILHIGRAMPADWTKSPNGCCIDGLLTYHGEISVRYTPEIDANKIVLELSRRGTRSGHRTFARFRHPEEKPIREVSVNGSPWNRFDAGKNDVDIFGLDGKISIEARF